VEKAKEKLHQAGESLGIVKPVQNIEGPLAEIQDVRKEMGLSRMEQPVEKSLTERAMETWNQVGETIEPYAERAKETLHEVGEKMGIVYPAQKIEGPLAEIQDVRKEMGWSRMEQPIHKSFSERVRETLNEAGERIEPYAEKARDKLYEAGEQIGLVNNTQYIEGTLLEIPEVQQDVITIVEIPEVQQVVVTLVEIPVVQQELVEIPVVQQDLVLQQKSVDRTEETIKQENEMDLFAERARQKIQQFNEQIELMESAGGRGWSQSELRDREVYQQRPAPSEYEEIQEPRGRGQWSEHVGKSNVSENIVVTQTTKVHPA